MANNISSNNKEKNHFMLKSAPPGLSFQQDMTEVLNDGGHLLIVDFNKYEKVVSDIVHNDLIQKSYQT